MSEFPAYEAALLQAARRRYGWRRWRPRVAVALVTAAAAAVALLLARPPQPDVEVPASVKWTSVGVHGVTVSVPDGWQLATATLTPHLTDPVEVFTAATFAPVRRATIGCAAIPAVTMGAGDALVTLQERREVVPASPRPKRFVYHAASQAATLMFQGCISGAATPSVDDFSDGGRTFTSIIVLGPSTTEAVRAQALQVLDRLRVAPRAAVPTAPAATRGSG